VPRLSIIIVSYNCRAVLSICLESLQRATSDLDAEVIIIDNASKDGTPDLVSDYFPQFKLIRNKENLGFSKSNNIGIRKSSANKVLLLNPDTIVFSSSLNACLQVFNRERKAAAVGIRMIDACGTFLPESKRGIPTPWRSFSKLSGLWSLAPNSKILSGYYWGWLDQRSNGETEILSGAFLMFDKVRLGPNFLLDERFFLFGEDIDFSYRILKKGFENFYLGETFIVHFKGESSDRKDSAYLDNFYGAMQLFSQKHFRGAGNGFVFRSTIKVFRWLRIGVGENNQEKKLRSIDTDFVDEKITALALKAFPDSTQKKDGEWIVLSSSSPELQNQFLQMTNKKIRGTIIWDHRNGGFFVSPGKGGRGRLVRPD